MEFTGRGLDAVGHWGYKPLGGKYNAELFLKRGIGFSFKHILSGVDYNVASSLTSNEVVIIRNTTQQLAKIVPDLVAKWYDIYGTYNITREEVELLTESLNTKVEGEDDYGASKNTSTGKKTNSAVYDQNSFEF